MYFCEFCDKNFPVKRSLIHHTRKMHNGDKNVEPDIVLKYNLDRHKRKSHKADKNMEVSLHVKPSFQQLYPEVIKDSKSEYDVNDSVSRKDKPQSSSNSKFKRGKWIVKLKRVVI